MQNWEKDYITPHLGVIIGVWRSKIMDSCHSKETEKNIFNVSIDPKLSYCNNCFKAENEMVRINNELQEKVEISTRKLKETNAMLEKKIAECEKNMEALRVSEERLAFAIEASGASVWDWNAVTNEVIYSDVWKGRFDYEQTQIIDLFSEWERLIHPEDKEVVHLRLKAYVEGLMPSYDSEYRMLTKSGTYKWILSRGKAISWTTDGKPLRITGINFNITSQKIMEQKLRESQERFSNVLKYSQDASYRRNAITNKYDYISPVIERITGYSHEEMTEMTLEEAMEKVHKEDLPNILQRINEGILESNSPEALEYRFLCKNGNYRWIVSRFTSIRGESLQPSFRYGVFQDITDLKLAEEELRKAKEEAEKASANKSEFIANMSHELRTPLNVNISAIQLFELYLKDSRDLDKSKFDKHLMPMKRNCLRLLRLVNNLIDSTKIDAGFYEPHFCDDNIVGVIERIAMSVSEYAKQKNIDLIFDTDVEEILISCDIDMVERIMLNLISNAIKFTKDRVNIDIYNKEDTVVIAVKDNGIGIEKENIDIIFQRYKQVSKLFTRETEGTGIGLSLTKSLVEMHNGSISVKSDYGNGSEFTIELPINKNIRGEVLLDNIEEATYNEKFIEKMDVEFSDIYK